MVVPVTSKLHPIPIRVPNNPPDGGLRTRSYVLPEMLRRVSVERLIDRWGTVSAARMRQIEGSIRALLGL